MTLEEEVKQMVDKILAGDKTIDVTDIVRLINERRGDWYDNRRRSSRVSR